MTISINDTLIKENNLTVNEFLYLLILYYKVDFNTIDKLNLSKNNYIHIEQYYDNIRKEHVYLGERLSKEGSELIRNILLDSDKTVVEKDQLEDLAKELQSLFPKGKKLGTNYYWRGSTPEIIRKLQIFFKRYGEEYSHEQIVNATKSYIDSFRDTRLMQLLKYFIWKDKPDGSQESTLLSYLENYGEEDKHYQDDDWTTTTI